MRSSRPSSGLARRRGHCASGNPTSAITWRTTGRRSMRPASGSSTATAHCRTFRCRGRIRRRFRPSRPPSICSSRSRAIPPANSSSSTSPSRVSPSNMPNTCSRQPALPMARPPRVWRPPSCWMARSTSPSMTARSPTSAHMASGSARAATTARIVHSYIHDVGAGGIRIGETQWAGRPDEPRLTHHITADNNILRGGGRSSPTPSACASATAPITK